METIFNENTIPLKQTIESSKFSCQPWKFPNLCSLNDFPVSQYRVTNFFKGKQYTVSLSELKKETLLEEIFCSPIWEGVHKGVAKTLRSLMETFNYPNIRAGAFHFIQRCMPCQRVPSLEVDCYSNSLFQIR